MRSKDHVKLKRYPYECVSVCVCFCVCVFVDVRKFNCGRQYSVMALNVKRAQIHFRHFVGCK